MHDFVDGTLVAPVHIPGTTGIKLDEPFSVHEVGCMLYVTASQVFQSVWTVAGFRNYYYHLVMNRDIRLLELGIPHTFLKARKDQVEEAVKIRPSQSVGHVACWDR